MGMDFDIYKYVEHPMENRVEKVHMLYLRKPYFIVKLIPLVKGDHKEDGVVFTRKQYKNFVELARGIHEWFYDEDAVYPRENEYIDELEAVLKDRGWDWVIIEWCY